MAELMVSKKAGMKAAVMGGLKAAVKDSEKVRLKAALTVVVKVE